MATRTVHIKITQPDATGTDQPWGGTVTWEPYGPGAVRAGTDAVVMPEPFSVTLVSGEATVVVERDDLTTWCWCVRWGNQIRYLTVPEGAGTVEFKDLPQINPGTFTATNPGAAWTLALAEVEGRVDVLEASPGGGVSSWNDLEDKPAVIAAGADQAAARAAIDAASAAQGAKADSAVQPAALTAAINGLIGAAPGALDTLDELAAALADDANYAATVTTALAGKLASSAALTQVATLLAAINANIGLDVPIPYATAAALGTRPSLPSNWKFRIYGGTTSDADPSWMVAGDYRHIPSS